MITKQTRTRNRLVTGHDQNVGASEALCGAVARAGGGGGGGSTVTTTNQRERA